MSDNFFVAINRVLGHEAGYVNDPRDPGGETKWGISKRQYPRLDIKNLSREKAIAIYYEDYWKRARCDEFDFAIAFKVMDSAVNHGIGTAIRFLQRAVGVADDGWIGPITIAAVKAMSVTDVCALFAAQRLIFYTYLSTWEYHGRGWVRRVAKNLIYQADDS